MAETGNMLSAYGSLLDVASTENAAIRDNAFKTANLTRGRGSVYLAGQAGGMLMSNLADMAGMKTIDEERQETIESILNASKNLDQNEPKTLYILGQQFEEAGFTGISQKFYERGRKLEETQTTAAINKQVADARTATAATSGQVKEGETRLVGITDKNGKPTGVQKTQVFTNGDWVDEKDSQDNLYTQHQFNSPTPSAADKNFELDQQGRDIIATGKYDTNTTEGLMSALVALQVAGLAGRPLSKTLRESLDKRLGLKDPSLVDITEISKLDTIYRQNTKTYQDTVDAARELDILITQAKGGNAIAYNALQQKTSQLIGDNRISVDEIRRLNNAGSIGQKVANLLSTWLTGVPTDARLADYRQVLDGIADINYARLKEKNASIQASLKAATPNPKQQEALLNVTEHLFALPEDPSKTTSRIQLENKRTLCRRHYSYVQQANKGDSRAGEQANLLAEKMGEVNIVCADLNWEE